MSCTSPVNISPLLKSRPDQDVLADHLHPDAGAGPDHRPARGNQGRRRPPPRPAPHPSRPREGPHPGGGREKERGDEDARLVDLIGGGKGGGEGRAPLEQQAGEPAPAELSQSGVDAPSQRRTSAPASRRAPTRVWSPAGRRSTSQRRLVEGRQQLRVERQAGAAVEDDAQRLARASPVRAVSSGSSARTVPIPTAIASHSPRQRWTSSRLRSPEIQGEAPAGGRGAAVERHRRLQGDQRQAGEAVLAKGLVEQARGRRPRSPRRRTRPRPRRRAGLRPAPAAFAVGSSEAITTRARSASRIASTQGGWRPWWAHGSSVTYIVAPATSSPAGPRRRAPPRSACRPPELGVEALADNLPVADDDRADQRIRAHPPAAALGAQPAPERLRQELGDHRC